MRSKFQRGQRIRIVFQKQIKKNKILNVPPHQWMLLAWHFVHEWLCCEATNDSVKRNFLVKPRMAWIWMISKTNVMTLMGLNFMVIKIGGLPILLILKFRGDLNSQMSYFQIFLHIFWMGNRNIQNAKINTVNY